MLSEPSEITESIEKLRQLTQLNVIGSWRYCTENLPVGEALQVERWNDWPVAALNHKGYVAWPGGRQPIWLVQRFVVPRDLAGYPLEGLTLRLALTWWAEEAQIFVDGHLVQQGDLFDCVTRLVLKSSVTQDQAIAVGLRLVSPGHDPGALVRSRCVYETAYDNCLEPGFVADELAVLHRYLMSGETYSSLIASFESQLQAIAWEALPDDVEAFERSLIELRQNLSQVFHPPSQIFLLGHAHLDLAWLWPIADTWDAAQRTFASVLNLMPDFPELTFCHSTAALYAWIEENRPDLFAAIQQQIDCDRWEVLASLWVEPELNIISGESIVRQVLYGQRYCLEKFGKESSVAWLPDSFGFCWQLPQIFQLGGIESFVTQKLRWNDTTKFPYDVFWWQSPDGTRIFSLMSAPIGEGIDPVKMANYACEWHGKTELKELLWLPGVGDHGGGPTRDMLEIGDRWQLSPFFPQMNFTTTEGYLRGLIKGESTGEGETQKIMNPESSNFPVWNDELYLEFHRGCYTTHAAQKRRNRRCEGLLYEAELFSALATIITEASYPKEDIESAWKKVLFNQFHDILPGSAIPEVYVDANANWQEVERVGTEILEKALKAIADRIDLSPPPAIASGIPAIVFNSLNWTRSQVVSLELPKKTASAWQVYDSEGNAVRSQQTETTVLFEARDIPSIGYRVFWLIEESGDRPKNAQFPISAETRNQNPEREAFHEVSFPQSASKTCNEEFSLENEWLRVEVDTHTGDLSRIFDKVISQEVLSGNGNQLQAFQDSGQYWDAWNINPNYHQYSLPAPTLKNIQWIEQGQLQQRVRVVRQLGKSEFIQDYILEADSPLLKIATKVNWQERHVLVKAAFTLNLEADFATYEIPCGAIERTAKPQTPAEQAKWEVPAINWADLSEKNYGVSVLNDCKYGYDAEPNQLRLTLLRGSTWPDPEADLGYHEFTYAIYPHRGDWKFAQTVRRGYELNFPLHVRVMNTVSEKAVEGKSSLKMTGTFLDLSANNLVLMAFKQSENNPQKWIIRCYESHGEQAQLELTSNFGLMISQPVNLLEKTADLPELSSDRRKAIISPWKIVSLECFSPSHQ